MSIVVSSFFYVITTLYLYERVLGKQNLVKRNLFLFYFTPIVMLVFSFIMLNYIPHLFSILFIFLLVVCLHFMYKTKFDLLLIVAIISRALYYFVYAICSMFITAIFSPYYFHNNDTHPNSFLFLATDFLTYVALRFIFKIKRLKSGMSFLTNARFICSGIAVSFLILILKIIDQQNSISVVIEMLIPFAIFFLAILLFYWWRKQITRSYMEKLRRLELHSLYEELTEKETMIKQLTEDNHSMAQIIHKDNKLIPALENAVSEFLLFEIPSGSSRSRQHGEELVKRLQIISQDRKGILKNYDEQNLALYHTGIGSIDNVLSYMQKQSIACNITFTCKHSPEALASLLEKISEKDLVHLLSDLLANSINALKNREVRELLLTFGILEKEAFLSIADTGAHFEIPTLHHLGLSPCSTHPEDGGSGIGWMDIWKLKEKYRVSIQIQEYASHKQKITKKITFSFNSRNHYVIQSYRHMDIINTQTRGDLYVIPFENATAKGGKST